MTAVWYRFEDKEYAAPLDEFDRPNGPGHTELRLFEFQVAKETPKGVRLSNGRLVLRDRRRRYACPTKTEALISFVERKRAQRRILQARLARVDRAIDLAQHPAAIEDATAAISVTFDEFEP